MICVYAGSFDPITVGHLDIIRRASAVFDGVIVAVLNNRAKRPAFSVEQRLEFIRRATEDIAGVSVDSFDGLLIDYLRKVGVRVILRGLRAAGDFESETQTAALNRRLYPDAETMFMMTSPEYACVSSTAVREIASFGGDISGLVPPQILDMVNEGFDIYYNRS
ncbi:MAG TPA: pantetheine-phosphate adenylyltransferase [Candidatus Fimadaptatus faecigallinarum]|uniref:Phosphopantetheine adenylyltransferase n=1 Tax=Candidatus Fimadaptatus faecigallinarum TaxID=2840814 RepID=A0A9D1LQ65_9FIRM|nr:pantetheine-phosphate adenylyltransferase [Candidatus Fimadaptatus faecigallinarum]